MIGTVGSSFWHAGETLTLRVSPRLTGLRLDIIDHDDGTGMWIEVGKLRPMLPHATAASDVERIVGDSLANGEHNQSKPGQTTFAAAGAPHLHPERVDVCAGGSMPDTGPDHQKAPSRCENGRWWVAWAAAAAHSCGRRRSSGGARAAAERGAPSRPRLPRHRPR